MANIGHGTTLSGASTGSIGQILSVGLPDQQVDDIDVTTMASTNKWREFMAGLKDAGVLTLQLLYEKSNYNTVQGALGAAAEAWTITFPDSSTFACSGYINANGGDDPLEDKITQSVTLKLSGEPTFTPAA